MALSLMFCQTRSPQMLMVSGVGPRDILAQQNIPVIVDRQVGQNWQVCYETIAE